MEIQQHRDRILKAVNDAEQALASGAWSAATVAASRARAAVNDLERELDHFARSRPPVEDCTD